MATASIPIPNPSEETLALWREERRRLTRDNSRLGFPFALRLPISTITGFCAGGLLGVIHGTKRTSLLFRAENAHRLPTTPTGWYLYHKSKNYQTAAGGLREGVRFGGKIAFWTALFFSTEELLDRARKGWVGKEGGSQNDVFSTVVASLSLAGAFSVWNRLPLSAAAGIAKTALKSGTMFGLTQDILGWRRGRKPGYVYFLTGKARPPNDTRDIPLL